MTNRLKFNKNNFIHTHDQILDGDEPYDALTVNRLNNNNQHLYETDGSVVSCDWTVGHPVVIGEDDSFTFTRPYCMASGWASIMQIPWLIQPGLNKIIMCLDYRVSTGQIDKGLTSPWDDPRVDVCLRLADHSSVSNILSYKTTNNEFLWAGEGSGKELIFNIDSGSFPRDPKLGSFYTVLNLCIRSRGMSLDASTISSNSFTSFTYEVIPIGAGINSETFVYNDAPSPFTDSTTNWPTATSPWISGVAVRTIEDSSFRVRGPFDIINKRIASNSVPINPDNLAFIYGDPTQQLAIRNNKTTTYVFELPYIQIRNYTIREEYLEIGEEI